MRSVRTFIAAVALMLLPPCPGLAQVYHLGQELLQNRQFSSGPSNAAEAAAGWRLWPEGVAGAGVAGTEMMVTARADRPLAGVYQRVELRGASSPSIRVQIQTAGPVLDLPQFEPDAFHGGIAVYVEYVLADGQVLYDISYPYYSAAAECSVIELQGPARPISHAFLVLGIVRGVGTVRFSAPSMQTFPAQPGLVTFQFDDGYASAYTEAYTRLRDAAYAGSLALVSSWVGRPGFVSAEQVRAMSRAGWDVLSHTRTHADLVEMLSRAGEVAVREEVTLSAHELSQATGLPIYHFASPFGSQNGVTQRIVSAEYDSQRDFFSAYNYPGVPPNVVHVTKVVRSTSTAEIVAALNAAQQGAWALFVLHDINMSPGEYDCTPRQFEELVALVAGRGLPVRNYEDALAQFASRVVPKQRSRTIRSRMPLVRPMGDRRLAQQQ